MEVVSWELESVINGVLWFCCNSLEMVMHVFWGGFVPCTSEWMLGFPECELVKMLIWITLWELLARVESHPAYVGKWQVKQTLFYQIVFSQFPRFTFRRVACQVSWTNYFSFEMFQLVKNSHSLLIPHGFSKRKDTFNTSHEESVIQYHQELKAIKVQISNPIAAKCLLVRSHLLTVFRCV